MNELCTSPGGQRGGIVRASLAAALLLLSTLHAGHVAAQSLNCGGGFFGVGDSKLAVLQRCGEPMFRQAICIQRPQMAWAPSYHPGMPPQQVLVQQCVPMEEWTYHRGQGNFMGIARFHNDTLESARDGARAP